MTSMHVLSDVLDPSIAEDQITRAELESEFSSFILARGTITLHYKKIK